MKSLITYLILVIILIAFSFVYYPKFKQGGTEATISWDVSGYYWYLPSAFIYHDLKEMKFTDTLREAYHPSPDNQQITTLPDGKHTLKYSCGMSIQYMPFFLIANSLATRFGYPQDGLSPPYQIAIHVGALMMMLLGLWYLRKFLLYFFKDITVVWVLVFLVLGTNYLNYAGIDMGMSHVWLFSWYCLLFYQTHQFYTKPSYWRACFIGFICGLLSLSRPTEIISIIIPLTWGVYFLKKDAIKSRFKLLIFEYKKFAVAALTMFAIGSLQLFYWKYVTGHWFVYSYGDQHFSWKHPHWYDYMFSYRNGWILYCPLMILPYLGFLFLKKKKEYIGTLLTFSILYLWSVTAWDVWWYGGRAMIQGYVALMFPFAALIEYVNSKRLLQFIFYPLAFMASYMNIWWIHGTHHGGFIDASNMTETYYHKIVGRMNIDAQDKILLDVSDDFVGVKRNVDTLLHESFNQHQAYEVKTNEQTYYYPNADTNLERAFTCFNHSIGNDWIRVSVDMICTRNNWDIGHMTKLGIRFYKSAKCVRDDRILPDRLFYSIPEQTIYFDAHINPNQYDSMEVYIFTPKENSGTFYFRNLHVESFNSVINKD